MSYATLIVETAEAVALIKLNRPEALNALNGQLMDELTAALDAAEADEAVRAIVITGSDRAFAAGADIKEMAPKSYAEVFSEDFITRNWERVTRCRKPVIAAVNGVAVGMGMGIAMACDVRIAAEEARFNAMFVRRGLASDFGLAFFLRETVGRAKALELMWRADFVSAVEALELGLVTRVVPAAQLIPACVEFLEPVLAHPPLAIETIKSLVNFGDQQRLSEYMLAEEALQMKLKDYSEDTREAALAFIERREPVFSGR